MALSAPRQLFGVHNVTPYSRTDGTPYGTLRCLAGSTLNFQGDLIEVFGGSSKYGWAAEDGQIKSGLALKPKEYPDFLFTLFMGKAPTATTSDAVGTLTALANKKGTSVLQATTGIATVAITAVTGAADLKHGKYLVIAASATTVDVYAYTDIDFGAKTNALTIQSDTFKVTASALTITTGGAVTVIPNTGMQFTGGSGTIGMTTGDTATWHCNPPSSKGMSVTVGAQNDVFPEFGCIAYASRRSNAEILELDMFRVKGLGFNIGFEEFKWSEADVKAHVLYDATLDGVFTVRHLSET